MNNMTIEDKIDSYLGIYSQYFPIYTPKYIDDLSEFDRKVYSGICEICNEKGYKPLFFTIGRRLVPESSSVVLCDTGICTCHSENYKEYKRRDDGTINMFWKGYLKYDNIHSIFYHESRLGFFDIWFGTKSKPGFFNMSYPQISILLNETGKLIPYDKRPEFANDICNFIKSINGNCKLYHD